MPELIEQMYCSQQIVIPPKYPYILKRFCKAAIKTQPYDLLRWAFEYFRALAEHRPPPVKLRLEYPIYSTEGGLTRGCLKVLAQQLYGMPAIPSGILKQAWQGFCLDPNELKRIMCLCEVYMRENSVPYLHFLAVAGGMLTKCLTHTMILLCESLTKEPDGGSAAIPVKDFLIIYRFLAQMDASKDVKYFNGYREGYEPVPEEAAVEEESVETERIDSDEEENFWDDHDLQRLIVIDDHVARTPRLSIKMNLPIIGKIVRSPSIERMTEIERENYMRERKGRPIQNEEIDKKLRQLSESMTAIDDTDEKKPDEPKKEETIVETKETIDIFVFDEEENPVTYEIYGEPKLPVEPNEDEEDEMMKKSQSTPMTDVPSALDTEESVVTEAQKVALFLAEIFQERDERLNDLEQTFDEITALVDRFRTANYDLGMVAGRQMSTTSGEFVVQHVEKEIMAYIDEQIAILPDPDLKKKKAKPEEVAMIRDILEQFLDDNMEIIVPEVEEVEEEELPIPEITMVYAVPGIGGPVDADIIADFEDYAKEVSKVQAEMMMPRNIRHFLCPPLEKYIEHNYAAFEPLTKEEVVSGGALIE